MRGSHTEMCQFKSEEDADYGHFVREIWSRVNDEMLREEVERMLS